MESAGSQDFNLVEALHQAEDDVEELIAEVKSEGEEDWVEESNEGCEEEYSADSDNPRLGTVLFKNFYSSYISL